MQPVVEFRKTPRGQYEYSVRAPRSKGIVPPPSFKQSGFGTLSDCVVDAGRGLAHSFRRVYVRYQGHCVGEADVAELLKEPARIAGEFARKQDELEL